MDNGQNQLPLGVVGAGPCGLAALKNFLALGIPAEALEREHDVGGNWLYGSAASSVYDSTRLISSKRLTAFADFPMPAEYPAFPSRQQALAYLQAYAERFNLRPHIRFQSPVERLEPTAEGWLATLANGSPARRYRGVVIANGHHWNPRWPDFPGQFSGQVLHAHQYQTPDVLRGQRVLVVGAGNSGCDIAVEAARHAKSACLSVRRGYHFLPKFLAGKPVDECGETLYRFRIPLALRRLIARAYLRIAVGPLSQYGLPAPDHRLFESHPIVNSQVLYELGHGTLAVRPNVARLDGPCVEFVDGRREEFDVLVYATGYQVSFPFIDERHLNWREGSPRLFLNAFHPQHDNLFVCGLIQPDGGIWQLADYQAQLMARFVQAQTQNVPAANRFRALKARHNESLGYGVKYLNSPRHSLEVQYFAYRARLQGLLRQMER